MRNGFGTCEDLKVGTVEPDGREHQGWRRRRDGTLLFLHVHLGNAGMFESMKSGAVAVDEDLPVIWPPA